MTINARIDCLNFKCLNAATCTIYLMSTVKWFYCMPFALMNTVQEEQSKRFDRYHMHLLKKKVSFDSLIAPNTFHSTNVIV